MKRKIPRTVNFLASTLWGQINSVGRRLSHTPLMEPKSLGCRVISVGNIQVGGAGKTPLVAKICNEAANYFRGKKKLTVCILTRGYRGSWETQGGVICPGDPVSAQECGDEAALLHELCPDAFIGVGADRIAQYEAVLAAAKARKFSIGLVVLDDGFQHFKIKKDLEIVALTSLTPFDELFRDSQGALDYADLIVWTKGGELPKGADSRKKKLVKVAYRLQQGAKKKSRAAGEDKEYWLVTGIAQGVFALELARDSGYRIAKHFNFEDHYAYRASEVEDLLKWSEAAGARIALTGKDWVKWRALGVDANRVTVLEPELELVSGAELWRSKLWGV